MRNPRMKHRRVVHKSTAGILNSIPEAVDPVANPPPGLTENTVAPPSSSSLRRKEVFAWIANEGAMQQR